MVDFLVKHKLLNSFSQRTINEWNKLSTDCVTGCTKSVNKTCLLYKIKRVHPLSLYHRIRAGVEFGRVANASGLVHEIGIINNVV